MLSNFSKTACKVHHMPTTEKTKKADRQSAAPLNLNYADQWIVRIKLEGNCCLSTSSAMHDCLFEQWKQPASAIPRASIKGCRQFFYNIKAAINGMHLDQNQYKTAKK